MQPVSKQQLCKYMPAKKHALNHGITVFFMGFRAATVAMQRRDKHLSSTVVFVFSALSLPRSYLEGSWNYSAAESSVLEC
jgi:hypothetical protein